MLLALVGPAGHKGMQTRLAVELKILLKMACSF